MTMHRNFKLSVCFWILSAELALMSAPWLYCGSTICEVALIKIWDKLSHQTLLELTQELNLATGYILAT